MFHSQKAYCVRTYQTNEFKDVNNVDFTFNTDEPTPETLNDSADGTDYFSENILIYTVDVE